MENMTGKIKLGKFLGSGAYKQAHAVKGDRTKVILMSSQKGELQEQKRDLETLSSIGIPSVSYGEIFRFEYYESEYDIECVEACLMKRYATGRDADTETLYKYLNHRTLESLNFIERQIRRLGVDIIDIQFLIDYKGLAYVADPGGVERHNPETFDFEAHYGPGNVEYNEDLHDYKAYAEYAIYLKSHEVKCKWAGQDFKAKALERKILAANEAQSVAA